MKKKITFLGIETSCDETVIAVIKENNNGTADILSNVVSSQIKEHEKYGGVVPEIAARSHLENIDFIINKALQDSNLTLKEIDGVAYRRPRINCLFVYRVEYWEVYRLFLTNLL